MSSDLATFANPAIIRRQHLDHFVDRLKELLERNLEHQRVGRAALAILDECGETIGDVRTGWAASGVDLIDIALTLQRMPDTSFCGLQIFERLMAANAYRIDDVLTDLDRRWPD